MQLTEFTEGASGSGQRWFVGRTEDFLDRQTFLEVCWEEFYLYEEFNKPSHEVVYIAHARPFSNYGEDDSPMEIEEGYRFCDSKEHGAFRIYVLDETKLTPLDHTNNKE